LGKESETIALNAAISRLEDLNPTFITNNQMSDLLESEMLGQLFREIGSIWKSILFH